MAFPPGVSSTDFSAFPLDDWGRDVTRIPRTQGIDNITGRESWTEGTPATIKAVVVRPAVDWMFDKDGQIEGGDAYIMVAPATTLAEGDLITVDSDKFYIRDLHATPDETNTIAWYANLFLYEDG